MTVEILEPHGFCAGVTGAIRKADGLSDGVGSTVYCLHELVHNALVVEGLRARGFRFVESVTDVPPGATVLFSAHGVAPSVRRLAAERRLKVVDATCPFVARVHAAARAFAARGLAVAVVGNPDHVEVRGIVGEVEDAGGRWFAVPDAASAAAVADVPAGTSVGVVSQTTMNADEVAAVVAALSARFDVESVAEVCQATKVRQEAVKRFSGDALLVLGSPTSSNTRRLCEVARCRVLRAATLDEVAALDLTGVSRLGVTSGASTPEDFFASAVARLGGASR